MWTVFKVFIEFVTILFLFYVLGFLAQGMWILAPWPGIELVAPELEGKVLTTGPPGESREHKLLSNHLLLSFHLAQQCFQKSRELTITAPIWAEQPIVLLWSRCIGVLSRNQLGSTLLSDSKEGPCPWMFVVGLCHGEVSFRSVKRKFGIFWKAGSLEIYSSTSKTISRLSTATKIASFIFHWLVPSSSMHIIQRELYIHPEKHNLVFSLNKEIKAEKEYITCLRSHSLYWIGQNVCSSFSITYYWKGLPW